MRRFLLLLALMVAGASISSAQNYKLYDDVIYGTDGTIVRGTIIEQVPGVSYKISTYDGSIMLFEASEIEKITKEETISQIISVNGSTYRLDRYGNVMYKKSPIWSAVSSFCVVGLGQIINGQTNKGLILMGAHVASLTAFHLGFEQNIGYIGGNSDVWDAIMLTGLAGMIGTWFYSLIDAPLYASRWNEENGFAVGDNKWLKVGPSVGVSSAQPMVASPTIGLGATLTF